VDYEWVRVYACMYAWLVVGWFARQDCLASIALRCITIRFCVRAIYILTINIENQLLHRPTAARGSLELCSPPSFRILM
jgi:hypothetical protein